MIQADNNKFYIKKFIRCLKTECKDKQIFTISEQQKQNAKVMFITGHKYKKAA